MLAPKLSPGDIIGIVSPSTPVEQESRQLKNGIRFLISMGFGVVLSKNVFANSLGYAASPTEKAADLMEMFAKPAVKAIICSQGGDTANACLPYLDWQVIRDHPKIFLGISDITVLLNAIYAKTGLVTFHGNDVMWGFGRYPTDYDRQEFLERLVQGKIGRVNPAGPRSTIRSGRAEGRLLGGNLRCLLKLAGTPYFPDFNGAVLFVELLGFEPATCDYMFRQLQQMGVFDQIRRRDRRVHRRGRQPAGGHSAHGRRAAKRHAGLPFPDPESQRLRPQHPQHHPAGGRSRAHGRRRTGDRDCGRVLESLSTYLKNRETTFLYVKSCAFYI